MKHTVRILALAKTQTIFLYLIIILLSACVTACDKVEGPGPTGSEIPRATAGLVTDSFPNATNVVFRTIEEDHLWEARFEAGNVSYYTGLGPDKIVAVHKLIGDAVPDSIEKIIRDKIPVAKFASLSDYRRELLPAANPDKQYYRAKMTVDGIGYLIKWNFNPDPGPGKTQIEFTLHEHSIFEFDTDVRYEPLPAALQAFQDRTDYFVVKLKTKVLAEHKIHYHFIPENSNAPMVLDNEGVLVGSYKFTEGYHSFAEFPDFIQKQLIRFGTEHYQTSVFCGKFSEDNNTGYRILTWAGSVTCDFFFDANGGIPSFTYGLIVNI